MMPANLDYFVLNTTRELDQHYADEMQAKELHLVSDEDAVEFEHNCVDVVKNAIKGLG